MTELVIRIDLKDMLDQVVPDDKPTVPTGYRCQDCWADDGGHESSCPHNVAKIQEALNGRG